MDELARQMLERLLAAAEKSSAGRRVRAAALTAGQLSEYRDGRSIQNKESFEAAMRAAASDGAVRLEWDGEASDGGFIRRIDVLDYRALASFLGAPLNADQVEAAAKLLEQYFDAFPVLREVIARWKELRPVRALGPESTADWLDAIRVIESGNTASNPVSFPIREASARLFNDSKRIEKLAGPLDVLLTGRCDLGGRLPAEIFQELGLFREEQPVRMAGNVILRRERLTAVIDRPYIAMSAPSVLGIGSAPARLLSIENLTTFHSEAKAHCDEDVLMIFTGGMPTPAWRAMYIRLLQDLPPQTEIFHWGDVDEGGFRIASLLAADAHSAGKRLRPWRMSPSDIPEEARQPVTSAVANRMAQFARTAGWLEIAEAVSAECFTAEQERLAEMP